MNSPLPPYLADRKLIAPETYEAFVSVMTRLEATLADENAAVAGRRHDALAELTRQKRQGFLELDRILRALERTIPSQDVITRLAGFRTKLAANEALLKRHLEAMQEVTNLLVKVTREHESDGTYSRSHAHAHAQSHAYSDWDAA